MSERLDPELARLESVLQEFAPAKTELNRERLMFEAGQASVATSSNRRWQTVSGVLAVLNVLMLLGFLTVSPLNKPSDSLPLIANENESRIESQMSPEDSTSTALAETPRPTFNVNQSPSEAQRVPFDLHEHSMQRILQSMTGDGSSHSVEPRLAASTRQVLPPPSNRELLKEFLPTAEEVPVRQSLDKFWRTLISNGEVL